MSLLDVLAQLLQYLTCWLPRPIIAPAGIKAVVRWRLSLDPRVLYGFVVVIPLIDKWEEIDLRFDPTEFEPVVVWTRNGRDVAVGMVIVWRVGDPLLCARRVNDLTRLVSKLGESLLPELVGEFDLEDFKRKAAGGEGRQWSLNAHLTTRARSLLIPYGIEVEQVRSNFTTERVRTFKLIGATAAPQAVME